MEIFRFMLWMIGTDSGNLFTMILLAAIVAAVYRFERYHF